MYYVCRIRILFSREDIFLSEESAIKPNNNINSENNLYIHIFFMLLQISVFKPDQNNSFHHDLVLYHMMLAIESLGTKVEIPVLQIKVSTFLLFSCQRVCVPKVKSLYYKLKHQYFIFTFQDFKKLIRYEIKNSFKICSSQPPIPSILIRLSYILFSILLLKPVIGLYLYCLW